MFFGFNVVFNNLSVISRPSRSSTLTSSYGAATLWYQVPNILLYATSVTLYYPENLRANWGETTSIVQAANASTSASISEPALTKFSVLNYTPRKLCLWEGILFSRCPSERPTDRPNVCPKRFVSLIYWRIIDGIS